MDRYYRVSLVALTLLSAVVGRVRAQNAPAEPLDPAGIRAALEAVIRDAGKPAPEAIVPGIAVSLHPDATELVPLEPWRVVVRVVNTSTTPIRVPSALAADARVFVAQDGSPYVERTPWDRRSGNRIASSQSWQQLQPGAALDAEALAILFGGADFAPVFSKPGRFRVKVRAGGAESKEILVTVRQPTADDAAAAELLGKDRSIVIFLSGKWWYLSHSEMERAIAKLESFAAERPKASVCDHANFELGVYFKHLYLEDIRSGKPDPKKNLPVLAKASDRLTALSPRLPGLQARAVWERAETALVAIERLGVLPDRLATGIPGLIADAERLAKPAEAALLAPSAKELIEHLNEAARRQKESGQN
jgi:hypothetical protein